MSTKLKTAVIAIEALPEEVQDAIADDLLARVRRHKELNEKLTAGERQLDAGEGIPAEKVIADLKARYAGK